VRKGKTFKERERDVKDKEKERDVRDFKREGTRSIKRIIIFVRHSVIFETLILSFWLFSCIVYTWIIKFGDLKPRLNWLNGWIIEVHPSFSRRYLMHQIYTSSLRT
jgi:hypothetical protein